MHRKSIIPILILILMAVTLAAGQGNSVDPRPREILKDADGNVIPNNEFRDGSLSDPQRKKPFTRTVLADGTVELRLSRNPFEGKPAPAFSVTTIDGKTIDAQFLKGKVLVLNVWFIGCLGCMEEIPRLNELALKYAGNRDVVFLALAPDPPGSLAEFIKKTPLGYLHSGNAEATIERFGVGSFPRNAVIGKDGRIAYWRSTVRAWEQFERVIKAELEKP